MAIELQWRRAHPYHSTSCLLSPHEWPSDDTTKMVHFFCNCAHLWFTVDLLQPVRN
uniref:Uncharacterized protein n=1 Tax=Arundo donax TaxID=35708 RepID=A0A0A8YUT6_ARUDO